MVSPGKTWAKHGDFHSLGLTPIAGWFMDGLWLKLQLKWMIWGSIFGNPPMQTWIFWKVHRLVLTKVVLT
jgi:hypothetical protein